MRTAKGRNAPRGSEPTGRWPTLAQMRRGPGGATLESLERAGMAKSLARGKLA
jgi:hypothetical protein